MYGPGPVRFQKWPGGRVRHIKNYVTSHLQEEKPDIVLIQAGGNDVGTKTEDANPITSDMIAEDVIGIAQKARSLGAKHVFIGGITMRSNRSFTDGCNKLNNTLKSLCIAHGFIYIDNNEILPEQTYDGVHLDDEGTRLLANNYLHALRLKINGFTVG